MYMYVEAAVHVTIQTFTLVQGFFLLQVDRWNKKKKSNSIFNEYYAVCHIFGIVDHQIKTC